MNVFLNSTAITQASLPNVSWIQREKWPPWNLTFSRTSRSARPASGGALAQVGHEPVDQPAPAVAVERARADVDLGVLLRVGDSARPGPSRRWLYE